MFLINFFGVFTTLLAIVQGLLFLMLCLSIGHDLFFEDEDCSHLTDNKKHGRCSFSEIDTVDKHCKNILESSSDIIFNAVLIPISSRTS